MWQKLYDVLVQFAGGILTSSTFLRTVRLALSALLTGLAVGNSGYVTDFVARAVSPLTGMTLTANWSAYVSWFQLANAWLPLSEMLLAITALWVFRGAFAALKVVEHIWDAVPFQ